MKQFFITILVIMLISFAWFIYQATEDNHQLQEVLATKNKEVVSLQNELSIVREKLADAEQNDCVEASLGKLVDHANNVLKEGVDVALTSVESELNRVKQVLEEEIKKLCIKNQDDANRKAQSK